MWSDNMGGSDGGGRGMSRNELTALEQLARNALNNADQSGKRNVFISFSSEDLNEVNLMRGQAKNENNNLEFNDHSLKDPYDSANAEYIKKGIREKINRASVTLCYISDSTSNSKWVDWEIRESLRLGKGVIAVHKGDRAPSRIPKAIEENGIKVVQWNHKNITKEIEIAAKRRE
jgi:hypothetical protein